LAKLERDIAAVQGRAAEQRTEREAKAAADVVAKQTMDKEAKAKVEAEKQAADFAEQRQQEMESRAKTVFAATRTPLEDFNRKTKELSELLSAGLIDEDTFQRARGEAEERFRDENKPQESDQQREDKRLAEELKRSTATPIERFEQRTAELNDLFKKGLIDESTLARAVRQEQASLERSTAGDLESKRREEEGVKRFDAAGLYDAIQEGIRRPSKEEQAITDTARTNREIAKDIRDIKEKGLTVNTPAAAILG
jgi:uncharacterized protein YqgQ